VVIWKTPPDLEALNAVAKDSILGHLGIEIVEAGDDLLKGTMPVDERTVQPFGILHGGASVVLAESLGSVASLLCVDRNRQLPVGIEVNANHLRSVRQGKVVGVTRSVHLGRTMHVWDTCIATADGKPVCVSRLTVLVRDLEE